MPGRKDPGPPAQDRTHDQTQDRTRGQTGRATRLLREMVMSNRLPPGSSHLEADLAETLGMSRTPVREAAITLSGQGLVEVIPRHGIRVLPLSATDMEEIYSILTELESLAAFELAARGIAAAALAELRQLTDEMDAALAADDRPRWAAADDRFHRRLVALAGNRRLAGIVATMSDQVHRARLLTLHMRPAPTRSNADHRALVDAIAAGQPERAREIHRSHRQDAKRLLLGLIARHGLNAV